MFNKKKRKVLTVLIIPLSIVLIGIAILIVLDLRSQENEMSLPASNSESVDTSFDGIEGLPADFPVYQNSDFITSATSDNGRGRAFFWETEDELSLVYEYLKSELRIKGWTLSHHSSVGNSSVLTFEKDGSMGFLGVFKGSSGKSVISVTIR